MPIKVDISFSSGGRFKPVSSHTLHEKRITIGRDQDCTLTLEDTQKHVSRVHAEVEQGDDCYWIKVVSKVNPISVNGKRHSYGERVPVVEGDQVHVGLYKLEIVQADIPPPRPTKSPAAADASEEITIPPAVSAPAAPKAPGENTRPSPVASAPVAQQEEAAEEEATYVPPVSTPSPLSPAAPPTTSNAPSTKLPDNEPIDDEVTYIPPMWARHAGNRPGAAASQAADLEDLTGIVRPPAVDVPSLTTKAARPKSGEQAATPSATAEIDFDLSDAFAEVATLTPVASPRPAAPPATAKVPEVDEGFSEDLTYVRRPGSLPSRDALPPMSPAPVPKATPPTPAAETSKPPKSEHRSALAEIQARIAAKSGSAAPTKSSGPAGPDKAVNAFLEGAGLSHMQIADSEAFMRQSGEMARAAVGGVLTLLMDRATARKELGAAMQEGGDENPLASLANPEEVIAFLFDPKRPAIGNSDPAQAFSGAVADLRLHQAALISAMRAAIMTTLLRVDPKRLEREQGSNLGMLAMTRKSKLWDLSVAEHEQLAEEIEQNFAAVFGQEILAAFSEQDKKPRGG